MNIILPNFPELKIKMDQLKLNKVNPKKEVDILDTYFCDDCCIYLLYKNVNKHYKSKTHLNKSI